MNSTNLKYISETFYIYLSTVTNSTYHQMYKCTFNISTETKCLEK